MKATIEKLKHLLDKAGISDLINSPVSAQDIAAWEHEHKAVIPEEIRIFLQFSNGFRYGWGSLVIFPLDKIRFCTYWDTVPDHWLYLGSVIGDGAYLVSDENGVLYLADHENHDEPVSRILLRKWIEEHTLEMIEEEYGIE